MRSTVYPHTEERTATGVHTLLLHNEGATTPEVEEEATGRKAIVTTNTLLTNRSHSTQVDALAADHPNFTTDQNHVLPGTKSATVVEHPDTTQESAKNLAPVKSAIMKTRTK